jgi:starch phosphorylase
MVRDYVERLYEPAAARADTLSASGYARARALASWKERVTAGWPAVGIRAVESEVAPADLGADRTVRAEVTLGELTDDDVSVQLLHGPVGPNDELTGTQTVAMRLGGPGSDEGDYRYEGAFSCSQAGRYGFTVRVVPSHPDLATPAETGCVTWA